VPQTWADTFISELNDTHIEADLRLRHTPPELEVAEVTTAAAAVTETGMFEHVEPLNLGRNLNTSLLPAVV
jgi:hypothetical protein